MLNYNDNEQTLLEFYHTESLNTPVETNGLSQVTSLETSKVEQLDALREYLQQKVAIHRHQHTEQNLMDPLSGRNVVDILAAKGVIDSSADAKIDRFLVLSQLFSPETFLSTVHEDTLIEQLVKGLDGLDRVIRNHTSELKGVLYENYEQFVSSKRYIDEILDDFKKLKSYAQQERDKSKVFNPALRRNLINGGTLSSELEESINNLNLLVNLMIRPVREHSAKEAKVAALIDFVTSNHSLFSLPLSLIACLARNDHDGFVDTYNRFLIEKDDLVQEQRKSVAEALASGGGGGDAVEVRRLEKLHTLQNTALARILQEVAKIATEYRRKAFKDLLSMDYEISRKSKRKMALGVKFIDLVDKLHRMSDEKQGTNPIYEFLQSQLQKVEQELAYQYEKYEVKHAQMLRRLEDYISSLAEQRPNGSFVRYIGEKFESVEEYFRASALTSSQSIDREKERTIVEIFQNSENLDLAIINETWIVLENFVKSMEEVFDSSVGKFVTNYVHYADPANGFDVDSKGQLRDSFFRVINESISKVMSIFHAQSPSDMTKVTPATYSSFLPHHTNSLSAMFYLREILTSFNKTLTLAGRYTARAGSASRSFDTNKQIARFREASAVFDQRVLEAICATWVNDCLQMYDLENWEKYEPFGDSRPTRSVYTRLMQMLFYYELAVLETLRGLLVRPEVDDIRSSGSGRDAASDSIRIFSAYPSKRVLVSLEIQFMRSTNVLIDSTIKRFKAEKAVVKELADYRSEQCTYKILTMNNLSVLGKSIFPQLVRKFDQLFSKNLASQNLKLYADLDLVKITILDDINELEKAWIEDHIDSHFERVYQNVNLPLGVDSFVYECLLHFVKLIHVLRPITDLLTFMLIIRQLQTQFLLKLLSCVREAGENERIIASILGNVKLDVDFFVEIFGGLPTLNLDEHCINLVRILISQINKIESMFSDLGYTPQEIGEKLELALHQSRSEFSCFGLE